MSGEAAGRAVWQASGTLAGRDYVETFLRHGVVLAGPGDPGAWGERRYPSGPAWAAVRQLATEVRPGDVVLLRRGPDRVVAAGVVASEYLYLPQFDDVDGLDLQHARRVRWFRLPDPYLVPAAMKGLAKLGFSAVGPGEMRNIGLSYAAQPLPAWQAPLPALPAEEPALHPVPVPLRRLVARANELADLYWEPDGFGPLPREDELLVHFVVPLLRLCDWPVPLVAVKWREVDVALFRALPRSPEALELAVEVKRLGAGVEKAKTQALGYLEALGVARDVLVTDGIRYRWFSAADGFRQAGYLNLSRLKASAAPLLERLRRESEGDS